MSIEHDVKRDVKRVATDIKHTIRPPWYRRAWNRVRRIFKR
ncbi:Group-specific protein [Caenorhabditis elegans]|uniref:Group-specific protein n=1 Tax=Caenorhabditis elegans TaxID=6239 RepID=Q93333_CAEEL|nr:Group-specific protein [Caenorhabditis elegans]CAB01689.2 Group-specific protein [Caenorhabditis elegans]|eukprot:NP_509927.2 Uncharacterized protein CELE_C35C5.9 [Caenorhabditis elegans]